jgi:hypothetical protein
MAQTGQHYLTVLVCAKKFLSTALIFCGEAQFDALESGRASAMHFGRR